MTDRFLSFLKAVWVDFIQKYEQEIAHKTVIKQTEGMFDRLFALYTQKEKRSFSTQEKEQALKVFQMYKQYQFELDQQRALKKKQQYAHEAKYFDALEVELGADFEAIKSAYKKAVKKYHPDKFVNDPEKHKYAVLLTQKINEAYAYFEKKFEK